MRKISIYFFTFVFVIITKASLAQPGAANIRYVTQAGAGLKDGSSWSNAYGEAEFQPNLSTAAAGLEFWVAAGTYKPTATTARTVSFTIPSGVSAYGGFAGTETSREQKNSTVNVTILSGDIGTAGTATDNSYHVVNLILQNTITLAGFTITGGYANGPNSGAGDRTGGGILMGGCNAITLDSLNINNNNAGGTIFKAGHGGGLYNSSSTVNIINTTITSNSATNSGGGYSCAGTGTATLINCVIRNNKSSYVGGGIANTSNISLDRCFLYNNTAGAGTNVSASGGGFINQTTGVFTALLTNCVIANNAANDISSTGGGGIANYGGTINLTNCTLSENTTTSTTRPNGNGISTESGATINLKNTIVWGLAARQIDKQGTINYTNSLAKGEALTCPNKTSDPLFVNSADPDGADNVFATPDDGLMISANSPAKNAGTASGAPANDVIGTVRPQGSDVDMGAYETTAPGTGIYEINVKENNTSIVDGSTTPSFNDPANFADVAIGSTAVRTFIIESLGSDNLTVTSINLTGADASQFTVGGISLPAVITPGNAATFTVTFAPITSGVKTATVHINSNDCDEGDYDFGVRNMGGYPSDIRYVSQNGAGIKDGSSWSNAYGEAEFNPNLSTASTVLEFWVASGTYKPTTTTARGVSFTIPSGVRVYGGFAGTETSRAQKNSTANVSILSGDIGVAGTVTDNSYHVVNLTSKNTITLDGFTISGGYADTLNGNDRGAGIYVFGCSAITLDSLKVINNDAKGIGTGRGNGGGLLVQSSVTAIVLQNSLFQNNKATIFGGAVDISATAAVAITKCDFTSNTVALPFGFAGAVSNSGTVNITNCSFTSNIGAHSGAFLNRGTATITNSIFKTNRAFSGGGAIENQGLSITLNKCVLFNNTVESEDGTVGTGGGLQTSQGLAALTNCVIANNAANGTNDDGGGGIMVYGGTVDLINCTLSENTTSSSAKPNANGISVVPGATVNLKNTIVYGAAAKQVHNDGTINYTNSLVKGEALTCPNKTSDPLFVNSADPDGPDNVFASSDDGLMISANSPAKNAGTSAGAPATDVIGTARPQGIEVDMGAYETTAPGASAIPEINVKGNNTSIVDGSTTPSLTDHTNFGNVVIGNNVVRTFTIESLGNDNLTITGINITGAAAALFTVGGISLPVVITPGNSATFTVTFAPTPGLKTATVNVTSNDCDEGNYDFAVQGTATGPAAALNFDGTNDYVSIPANTIIPQAGAVTVEAWINYSTGAGNLNWFKRGSTNGYGLYVQNNTVFVITYGSVNWNTAVILTPDTWTHIAFTFDGTTQRIYKNGTLAASLTAGYVTASTEAYIGTNLTGSEAGYFRGSIDELRVWNRALCQGEIANNMGCEISTTGNGLLANYHFNQGVAGGTNTGETTLINATGNGYNGTLTNFALTEPTSNWTAPGAVASGISCAPYLAPEINVQGNNVTIVDGDDTPSITDNTDFGSVNTGANVIKTFTIQNPGTNALTVTGITITGTNASSFTPGVLTPSSPIAAGSSATFTLTFAQTSLLPKTATVHISNNDCDEGDYDFAVLATGSYPSNIRYVTQTGGGSKDGSSWSNAYGQAEFQPGLSSEASGVEFWVAAGTYRPTSSATRTISFVIPSGVNVYGGFSGTETLRTQRNPATNVTILSGDIGTIGTTTDNSYNVVKVSGTSVVLDGFTITAGNANGAFPYARGGGIYQPSGAGTNTYANLKINNNIANSGGGMRVDGGIATLTNCDFTSNTCGTGFGGGLNNAGTITVSNSNFTSNSAYFGGGFYNSGTATINNSVVKTNRAFGGCAGVGNQNTITLTKCFLYNNLSHSTDGAVGSGGGFQNSAGNATLTNCVIANNAANGTNDDGGGGVMIYGGVINLTNCTLSENTTASNYNTTGNGISIESGTTVNLNNTIVYGAAAKQIRNGGSINYTNSLVKGEALSLPNKASDPLFVSNADPDGADNVFATPDDGLMIFNASPAKDAGTSTGAPADDVVGTGRPQGAGFDIGAYEVIPCNLTVSVTLPALSCDGANVLYLGYGPQTLTAIITDGPATFKWYRNGDVLPGATGITYMPTTEGTYYVIATSLTNQRCLESTEGKPIKVIDVRCFDQGTDKPYKIYVCHKKNRTQGNGPIGDNAHTLCVDASAVPAHLAHGDCLGQCPDDDKEPSSNASDVQPVTIDLDQKFAISGYPNPSRNDFSIRIGGGSTERTTIRVTDISGRLIEQRTNVAANHVLRIGNTYRPGMYYVEVIQGKERRQLKLVKQ